MTSHREALDALARARQTSSLNPPTAQDQPNEVPPPRHRVIVDTDAANECDDQFAIVHALLSPTLDVRGVVAAHFGLRRSTTSMADSRAEIDRLLALLGDTTTRAADGAATWIPDERTPIECEGARLIIEESFAEDSPLSVLVLGPLSTVASALLLEPRLVERGLTVIWIGGGPYDGLLGRTGGEAGIEFNLSNDIAAANVVLSSGLRVIQVPETTYRMCSVGYHELEEKIGGAGELGAYLVRQMIEWNARWNRSAIERRSLGDSPAVGLVLNGSGGVIRRRPAPRFAADGSLTEGAAGCTVDVVETFDMRYLFEDMFAKIRAFATTA
ncbi:nucleoside hydrolase [Pseudactinotalea terrae]|uniref:nucleoside hydrolase n=1 Tax=Pseudactinotalea terrae TaxID=1743262 RepID=UPI0012E20DA0|nr:nucleoside hydrolase [Pseudactinotalea terrae]